VRHRLVEHHPALAARYATRFAAFERELVEEIGRRVGADPDADPYPAVVVTAALGAVRVAITQWQGRARPVPIADLLDDVFATLSRGLTPPR
jgi:hypothetical protein